MYEGDTSLETLSTTENNLRDRKSFRRRRFLTLYGMRIPQYGTQSTANTLISRAYTYRNRLRLIFFNLRCVSIRFVIHCQVFTVKTWRKLYISTFSNWAQISTGSVVVSELIEFRSRNKKKVSLSQTSTLKIQTFPSVKITKRNQLKVRILLNIHHYDKESRSSDV